MKAVSQLVIGTLLAASAARFQHPSRTRWRFELRSGDRPTVVRLPGSLELDPDLIGSDRLSAGSGDDVLGKDSLQTLPAPLEPDPCVPPAGKADVFQTHDSVFINFTLPHASDCGLIVHGAVRSDTVVGTWYQRADSGYRGKGPFVMWREH